MKRWQEIVKRLAGKIDVRGAEIGVERGKTAQQLLAQPNIIEYVCVDQWRYDADYAETAKHKDTSSAYHDRNFQKFLNLASNYPDKVRIYTTKSKLAAKIIPNDHFDFVFIDANHNYQSVYEDIMIWRQKIKHGGFICGHDWGDVRFPGVSKAVEDSFYMYTTRQCNWKWPVKLGGDFTWFATRP